MHGYLQLMGMIEALLVSIPESVSLLVFGLGLIGVTATGRWVVSQVEHSDDDNVGSGGLR